MPVKLIAMDMDGTLLSSAHTIPPENLAALKEAHARGIHLSLCSGRMPDDAGFFAVDAGLPMHILALNGTCCLNAPLGNITLNQCMTPEDVRRMLPLLNEARVQYGVFGGHKLVLNAPFLSNEDIALHWGTNILRAGGRSSVRFGCEGLDEVIEGGVNKIVAIAKDSALLPALRIKLENAAPNVEVSSSWHNNLELNAQGANKGSALRALASSLGVDMPSVLALGDNDNDIPMISAAGIGVVMANGTAAAKAAAKYMTLSNSECGVAAAIRHFAFDDENPWIIRL